MKGAGAQDVSEYELLERVIMLTKMRGEGGTQELVCTCSI